MSVEEYMDHCRKLALNALKPTEKELQHGLELHKEAFVFDAYGFMPLAGDKCPRLDQLIKENAELHIITISTQHIIFLNVFFTLSFSFHSIEIILWFSA